MATHSSILVWRITWTEEPGGLLSIGSQRARHDWSDLTQHTQHGHPIFNFFKDSFTVFHSSYTILHFPEQSTRLLVFLHPCQHLLFYFFESNHSVTCEMVSRCSFDLLFSNDIEHHITCLLAIYISSLEKFLLKLLPVFHLVCFFWLLSFRNSPHSPDGNPLSSTCLCKALLAHAHTHSFAYRLWLLSYYSWVVRAEILWSVS